MLKLVPLIVVLFLAMLVGGCLGLSPETQARIDAIGKQNEALAQRLKDLAVAAKTGTLSPTEIAVAVEDVRSAISKNMAEIEKIRSEGASAGSTIAILFGLFGRTALHGVGSLLPATGPLGIGLQSLLTLLLGGSETKKVSDAELQTSAKT